MKISCRQLFIFLLLVLRSDWATAQDTNLDLSTRSVGVSPNHLTPTTAVKWMQNPVALELEIVVTNFYAATNAYLEIDMDGQSKIFYGAGQDSLGNYIPTNYLPVEVDAAIRRQYSVNLVCPNSGPDGSPLFKLNDINNPGSLAMILNPTNTPNPISTFLWTNFSTAVQFVLTNDDPSIDPGYLESKTNLAVGLNRIITQGSIYDPTRFSGVYLNSDTVNLLAKNPHGQDLVYLNRLLLRDAYSGNYTFLIPSAADDSGTAQVNFFINTPPQIIINNTLPPSQYSVLINGSDSSQFSDGSAQINLINSGYGDLSTNYSIIQVTKAKFAHYSVGDGCDDASKAPGEGRWLSLGPGCSPDTNRISLEWAVSLGRTFDGLAAGQLAIHESSLSRDTYTPFSIYYNGSMTNLCSTETLCNTNLPYLTTNEDASITTNQFVAVSSQNIWSLTNLSTNNLSMVITTNVQNYTNCLVPVVLIQNLIPFVFTNTTGDVYTNYESVIRQVKSYQTFVDVVSPDTNQTILNFYQAYQVATNRDSTGLYNNFSGSPFVTWTIQNPNPSTTDNLLIIESRYSSSSTQSLVKASSTGGVTWTLTQGDSTTARVESRKVTFSGSPATDRQEVDTINYSGASTPAYECRETYHFYPWGNELVETRIPSTPDYVTSYKYYNNDDPINDPNNYGYSQLALTTYPDGYWEKRIYWTSWNNDDPELIAPLEILHPFIDDKNDGATSPDSANADNSSVTIASFGDRSSGMYGTEQTQFMTMYDYNNFSDEQCAATDLPENSDGNGFQFEAPVQTSYSGHGDVDYAPETRIMDYYQSAPLGLSGHQFIKSSNGTKYYYYDHGVFDSNANVFQIDATNHFYTVNGVLNDYPDYRETEVDYPYMDDTVFDNLDDSISGYGLIDNYSYTPDGQFSIFDGHSLGAFSTLLINVTKKNTRIYQGGNLRQVENYVYTGSSTGQTGWGITSAFPQWALIDKTEYFDDSLGRVTNVIRIDPVSSQTRTLYTADYRGGGTYDGKLLVSETDEFGQKSTYTYDALQRVISKTITGYGSQPSRTIYYTLDANGQMLKQVTVAGTLSQNESASYDIIGRMTNHLDMNGVSSQIFYSSNNLTIITVYPGGITNIQSQYLDRQAESVSGNGCIQKFFYNESRFVGLDNLNIGRYFTRVKKASLGYSGSPRWTASGLDAWGNDAWDEHPASNESSNSVWNLRYYDESEPAEVLEYISASSGNPQTQFGYDAYGTASYKSVSDNDGNTRNTYAEQCKINISGDWFDTTTNFVFLADGSDAPTVRSIRLDQRNGFSGNEIARVIDYDADTNKTITSTYLDRDNNKIITVISEPSTSCLNATNVMQNGLPISSSTLSVSSPTLYFYDALARTNQIQSPLGFSAYKTYDPVTGWLTSMTDFTGQMTAYQYYNTNEANAGKLKCQISANGKKTWYAYTTRGELYRTWGDVPYPAEYHYSEYGDLTNLITFRGGTGWAGSSWPASPGTGDNTYWNYDAASGALLQKIDTSGHSVNYTYDTNTGRLFTRTWARMNGANMVTVTNKYNDFGDPVSQEYNDGTPSVYFNSYNRAGQPREIIDDSGTNELTYDFACRLMSTYCQGGLLAGITVSNHFNSAYGRDSVSVQGLPSSLEDDFGYDAYGRLATIGSGAYSAVYSYAPNSDLLQTTTCYNNFTPVLTTTRTWDYGMRLRSINNVVNNTTVTSHSYQYDALNRRTAATQEDGSFWQYGYNDRDELTSANRSWSYLSTSMPVAGQQYFYAYDNIGNRQTAYFGGDTNGANVRAISYTVNNLNQYTDIQTPGYENINGAALATNTVTVNNGLADRHGEYFHQEIAVANSSGPLWQNVTNISGTFTNQGSLVVPAGSQALIYDADGNLTFDGIWNYQWDGENRLTSMTMTNVSGIANANRLKIDFSYDYIGRRISKKLSAWNGENFITQSTNQFIYDGWNLVAIISPSSQILSSYMWGNDISGSITNAGGVSGLLLVTIANTNCFVGYDGNGNITALINAVDKSLSARYEYSPYGELIRSTGLLASENPFRFSTKFWDEESGLVYFNFRFYSPALGRWINRDPTTDQIFLQLYLYCKNNPINRFDIDGKDDFSLGSLLTASAEGLWIDVQLYTAVIIDASEVGESVSAVAGIMTDAAVYTANNATLAAYSFTVATIESTGAADTIYFGMSVLSGAYIGNGINGLPGKGNALGYQLGQLYNSAKNSPEGVQMAYGIYNAMIDAAVNMSDP